LRQKGFWKTPVDEALARLRELGYVNDASFARLQETQQSSRPRSRRLLTGELPPRYRSDDRRGGDGRRVSDEEAAYTAAARRLRALRGLEYQRFRERLGSFLTRRGFSYDVARRTIEQCWAEVRVRGDDGRLGLSPEAQPCG
jgi:regulatory protein